MYIKIKNGLDVPVDGAPEAAIDAAAPVSSVALVGSDYVDLDLRVLREVGDRVQAGQPLAQLKHDPEVVFTAPGAGTVAAINRGARRVLKSIVINLEAQGDGQDTDVPSGLDNDLSPRGLLLKSGLWTAFRTRPFSRIPDSRSEPAAIFVTAMDSRPLAADPALIVAEQAQAFATGLATLTSLTAGKVYLCSAPDWSGPTGADVGVVHAVFDGPHPAGLPGTHIHYLEPAAVDQISWHIGYQDVIAIGKLIGEGRYWFERVVALGGTSAKRPRLLRTRLGADVLELLGDELRQADGPFEAPRVISGSVLGGREAKGSELWLGRYHCQIAALTQPQPGRRLRWRRLFDGRYSFAGLLARHRGGRSRTGFSTDQNGRTTALVPIDAFERLIPLDMLTEPLLRALLIKDTDQAQALGCLELDEEDLALCSFVCPGKNDYGAVLRVNLDEIEREG